MRVTDTIIKTGVPDIMMRVDDVIDHRVMSRAEAMKFLREMMIEIDVRIGWVRDALRTEQQQWALKSQAPTKVPTRARRR